MRKLEYQLEHQHFLQHCSLFLRFNKIILTVQYLLFSDLYPLKF